MWPPPRDRDCPPKIEPSWNPAEFRFCMLAGIDSKWSCCSFWSYSEKFVLMLAGANEKQRKAIMIAAMLLTDFRT